MLVHYNKKFFILDKDLSKLIDGLIGDVEDDVYKQLIREFEEKLREREQKIKIKAVAWILSGIYHWNCKSLKIDLVKEMLIRNPTDADGETKPKDVLQTLLSHILEYIHNDIQQVVEYIDEYIQMGVGDGDELPFL